LLGRELASGAGSSEGAIENTFENRVKIARVLRVLRARGDFALLAGTASRSRYDGALGYDACFVSGLAKVDTGALPHRPFKNCVREPVCGCCGHRFVVDITPFIEQRHNALMAYKSQYANQTAGTGLFCSGGRDSRAHVCGGAALRPVGRALVTASRLCKGKWGWWTI